MGEFDLWSLITVVATNNQQVEDLLSVVEDLPTNQKAELVKRLLKSADLNVTFGNNQLSGTIIVQINAMDQAALGDILQAIANRISSEPSTKNKSTDETIPPIGEENNNS